MTVPQKRRSTRVATRTHGPMHYEYGACPSGPVIQGTHFYTAGTVGEDRKLITNAVSALNPSSPPITPQLITSLQFDASKWTGIPRPNTFIGVWPPVSASPLMNTELVLEDIGTRRQQNNFLKDKGDESVKNDCLGKYCWQTGQWASDYLCARDFDMYAICDHDFAEWLQGSADWESRFEIRNVPGMGYGLFSKWAWHKGDVLGAYLGELIPEQPETTDYCHQVQIGLEFTEAAATFAYIDAEEYGNFTRFANHSCENNAIIMEARVGKERVLALRAVRSIAVGEQVWINYGDDYFRHRRCLCGSKKCKYPNASNPVEGTTET